MQYLPGFLQMMADEDLKATTQRDYRTKLQQFARWLEAEGADFNRRAVIRYLTHLREAGRRPRTIRCTYTALRSFCRFLASQEVPPPPLENIRLPRMDVAQRRTPTDGEVKLLFAGAHRMPAHSPIARRRKAMTLAILATFTYCGLRAAELRSLDVSDYHADTGRIYIRQGKGGQSRWVPVNDRARDYLTEWLALRKELLRNRPRNCEALFLNDKYQRLGVRGLQSLWNTLLEFAGLSGSEILRHSIRHYAATVTVKLEGLAAAQRLLGHANMSTTMQYTHCEDDELKRATDGIGDRVEGERPEPASQKQPQDAGTRQRWVRRRRCG